MFVANACRHVFDMGPRVVSYTEHKKYSLFNTIVIIYVFLSCREVIISIAMMHWSIDVY